MKKVLVSKITAEEHNKLIEQGFTVVYTTVTSPMPRKRKVGVKLPKEDHKKLSAPAVPRKLQVCTFPHVRRSK